METILDAPVASDTLGKRLCWCTAWETTDVVRRFFGYPIVSSDGTYYLDKTLHTNPLTGIDASEGVIDRDNSGLVSASVLFVSYIATDSFADGSVFLSAVCSFFWLPLTCKT